MKTYKYGEIVAETDEYDFIKSEQDRLVEYHGYVRGDYPEYVNTKRYSYVLVIGDSDYADVEYRDKQTQTVMTRSEVQESREANMAGIAK